MARAALTSIEVMRACADPSREDGWITGAFIGAYTTLHEMGWAHSVEVFDRGGRLAGGLYGVRINGLFAGESMFHAQRDASKVALMALVQLMRESDMQLLDVQWCTSHLASLGSIEVSRAEYLTRPGHLGVVVDAERIGSTLGCATGNDARRIRQNAGLK